MSRGDVTAEQQDLVDFLQTAPPQLRGWAEREIAALDPDGGPVADAGQGPLGDGGQALLGDDVTDQFDEDLVDELAPDGAATPAEVREVRGPARRRALPRLAGSRGGQVGMALVVLAAMGVGVYRSGSSAIPGLSGTPGAATPSPTAGVDQGKAAELMRKLSSAPQDVTTLTALGDLYFQGGDYAAAAVWQQRVLDVAPTNVTARLALGASRFNSGDNAQAERAWQQAVAQDPRNAEAHYDLGFLYLSQSPPDQQKVRQEWEKVVQIDPNSQIAKTVATHLQSLQSPSPQASSPGPPGAGTPSAVTP